MRGPATPIRTDSRPSHTIAAFLEAPCTPRMTSSTWLFSITLATSVGGADRFQDATGLSFECQTIVRNSPFDVPMSIVPVGAGPFHICAVRSRRRGKGGFRRPSRIKGKLSRLLLILLLLILLDRHVDKDRSSLRSIRAGRGQVCIRQGNVRLSVVGCSTDCWAGGGKKGSMSALAVIRISDRAIRAILPASLV